MEPKTAESYDKAFASAVAKGLSAYHKYLPTRYIYDDEGTRLFEEIMKLDEYYLTRCEIELFKQHKSAYADLINGRNTDIVELGAGNGEKTQILLEQFINRGETFTFRPIDISKAAIDKLETRLLQSLPSLNCEGMVADYFEGLHKLNAGNNNQKLVLFLGANIGNFEPRERGEFLSTLKENLNPGDIAAIGFDLKKPPDLINRAYNDKAGVTAAFNMNLLHRINRELDGNFNPENFRFYAAYNPFKGAVVSTLISKKAHTVSIAGIEQEFRFEAWEPIHTESSFKFTQAEINQLAKENGFYAKDFWTDPKGYYANAVWEA